MIQQTGITLNNSHLLRAAMAFAVIGVIGPGLFQVKPPQWLGSDAPEQSVEVLSPPAEVGGEVALPEEPAGGAGDCPCCGRPPVAKDVVPAQSVKFVETPSPETSATQPLRGPNAGAAGAACGPAAGHRARGSGGQGPARAFRTGQARGKAASGSAGCSARRQPQGQQGSACSGDCRADPDPQNPGFAYRPSGPAAKDSFVSIVLPLILAANEEIGQRRSAIMRAADAQDMDSLQRWAKLYRVNTDGRSIEAIRTNILDRADFIPVSLALAQAAIESGWGTSRFARQGNALFGQWAWQASQGIKPAQASNMPWCTTFPISSARGPICTT